MAMNKKIVSTIALSGLTAALLTFTGCGSSSSTSTTPTAPVANCDSAVFDVVLTGDITSDMTLDPTKKYGIDGKVRVMSPAVLTAPAGTTFGGCAPSSYLLVKPGAQLVATGTMAAPVTFTSQTDLKGLSSVGATGEWGGLILLGNAYTDHGVTQYEAGDVEDTFGSADHTHDAESSGTLQYVLVKHTGYEVEVDKELNGLSLGGVGSGTTMENIAIVGGSDDGMEIWGGTVNLTGLYVNNAKDDSVDTDLGYRGNITDVYVKQFIVDKTNNHDSATIETGNDTNSYVVDDNNATQPVISNFTGEIVGAGIYMKNDAGLKLTNAIFTSSKTVDAEMVTYRTIDVVDTAAMHASVVCFDNLATNSIVDADYFENNNTKDTDTTKTALTDWTNNPALSSSYTLGSTAGCTGADIPNIWKGSAGSNLPVE